MSESCVRHPMNVTEFACGRCGHDFCPQCVVFPYGLGKPPMCITCALQIGGISRRESGRPKLSRREIRQRVKERKRVTVTRSELHSSGAARPAEDLPDPDDDRAERWIEGHGDAEEFPGGWRQVF